MIRLAALAVLCLVGACGGSGIDAELRIVVPDNNIREEGVECAGARPFRAVHRGAAYSIEDGAGEIVADGELPTGRAENADPSVDWGVERIPTVCVFDVEVDLPERARYRLVLPDTLPVEFERRLLEQEQPLRLVLSG
jgi:hypothetical protein